MPLKFAGLRSEPPRSLPSASGSIPVANAAPAPPLDPPALLVGSCGLRVVPYTLLYVCDPIPNSGTLVLPIGITPARRSSATSGESVVARRCLKMGEPDVQGNPAASSRSLNAQGKPCNGPT